MDRKVRLKPVVDFAQSWWAVLLILVLVCGISAQRWHFTHPTRSRPLAGGERVPSLKLADLRGNSAGIDWHAEAGPTVLYVFSPACKWCSRNLKALRAVLEKQHGYRFVGLSITAKDLAEYVRANSLAMPIYVLQDRNTRKALRVIATPETILVSQNGVVQKVWMGAWSGRHAKEIEQQFGVTLPAVDDQTNTIAKER